MSEKLPEIITFSDVDITNPLILKQPPYRFRRCSIIGSLADPHITVVEIQNLLEAGMSLVKIKIAQNSKGQSLRLLGKIDKATLACCTKYGVTNWPVATCIELKTCIVNTGTTEDRTKNICLKENSEVLLTYDMANLNKCNDNKIFIDNQYILTDINVGGDIFIDGNNVIMKCISRIDHNTIKCIVTKNGTLNNNSAVCARQIKHSTPLLTKEDFQSIIFALEYQIDVVIVNYVRQADSIKEIKKFIKSKKVKRPVILSGICTEECLENIDDIIKESDGIIMSREYLPYETKASYMYRLANIQKWLSGKCIQAGKPFYISGGVFEIALKTGEFIDCEISDVTNALMDDVSGFLLKESSDSSLTFDVLKGINELCYTIDPLLTSKSKFHRIIDEVKMPVNAAEAAVIACATVANQTQANIIVIPTVSGTTMKYLHWMRPSCLIITVSPEIRTTRLLRTYRSVMPLLFTQEQQNEWSKAVEARIYFAIDYAVNRNWLMYGDTYITLERGSESTSFCDTVRVCKVSISKKTLVE
ncbi:putative pyruvate kinase [Danaus plexippus plexippus]|uniref:Pyruvate kinase n=1 Tax=Danaus plexippus plexippus TaxID=278856 RepID=A0A212FH53_DANPL|nr:pyruvate kinase-like isoform X2 [Danaus plexippus plexippus]OWR53071.1 putative pyruvate kinase [Danaus plexippus plexippus]